MYYPAYYISYRVSPEPKEDRVCRRGQGRGCDNIKHLSCHIKEKLVWKAWGGGGALLKGPGDNTEIYAYGYSEINHDSVT